MKLPGTKRLKLNYDVLLSTSAFKFNLRHYPEENKALFKYNPLSFEAGAYTRLLLSST